MLMVVVIGGKANIGFAPVLLRAVVAGSKGGWKSIKIVIPSATKARLNSI